MNTAQMASSLMVMLIIAAAVLHPCKASPYQASAMSGREAFLDTNDPSLILVDERDDVPAILEGLIPSGPSFPTFLARIIRSSYSTDTADCTGALISVNFVLTAASCITKLFWGKFVKPQTVTVVLGDYSRITTDTTREQTISGQGIPHPSYPSRSFKDAKKLYDAADIGVVQLSRRATLNQFVTLSPINADPLIPRTGSVTAIISWGAFSTSTSSSTNSDIYRVAVGLTEPPSGCVNQLQDSTKQICMDGARPQFPQNYAPCNGDAGAPGRVTLVNAFNRPLSNTTVGVASFPDLKTCVEGEKFVLVRTSAYYSWISQYL